MDKLMKHERKASKKKTGAPDKTHESEGMSAFCLHSKVRHLADEVTVTEEKKRSSRRTSELDAQPLTDLPSTKHSETSKHYLSMWKESGNDKKCAREWHRCVDNLFARRPLRVVADTNSNGENSNQSLSASGSSNATPLPSPGGSDAISERLRFGTRLSDRLFSSHAMAKDWLGFNDDCVA